MLAEIRLIVVHQMDDTEIFATALGVDEQGVPHAVGLASLFDMPSDWKGDLVSGDGGTLIYMRRDLFENAVAIPDRVQS